MANNLARAANEGREVIIHIEVEEERCIHRVPKILRKVNEKAYTPKLISIGPYYYRKKEFADMVKHKRRYKKAFFARITEHKRKELISFIRDHEEEIRRQYSEPCFLTSDQFVRMILSDAIFIIQLFLTNHRGDISDFLLQELWLGAIRRDLLLLENQLPYFVLEELYKIAFLSIPCHLCGASLTQCSPCGPSVNREEGFPTFRNLSCVFFRLSNEAPYDEGVEVKHFTDLCRQALVGRNQFTREQGPINKVKELPNVVKLRESGVKFKGLSDSKKYLVNVDAEEKTGRIFNEMELQMPPIGVCDDTECLFRNVMALEQCHYPSETYICGYIELMDFLIENEEDVDHLVKNGIISNSVGSQAVVVDMFNKLCRQIPSSISYYSKTCNDLRRHYDYRWNHSITYLKSTYFGNLWRGTATVVAFILVILTLAQTVCSILQVV